MTRRDDDRRPSGGTPNPWSTDDDPAPPVAGTPWAALDEPPAPNPFAAEGSRNPWTGERRPAPAADPREAAPEGTESSSPAPAAPFTGAAGSREGRAKAPPAFGGAPTTDPWTAQPPAPRPDASGERGDESSGAVVAEGATGEGEGGGTRRSTAGRRARRGKGRGERARTALDDDGPEVRTPANTSRHSTPREDPAEPTDLAEPQTGPVEAAGPERAEPVERVESGRAGRDAGEASAWGQGGGRSGRKRRGRRSDGQSDGQEAQGLADGERPEGRSEGKRADPEARARDICLRSLGMAPRTRAQLAELLRRKEIPDEVAERVLSRFTDVGLIDDEAFAQAWVQSRHNGRGLARRALVVELRRRGVAEETVNDAVDTLDSEQEEETARRLIARKAAATRGLDPVKRTRRLVGVLARKGYSPGMAYRVVREVLAEDGAEIEEMPDPE